MPSSETFAAQGYQVFKNAVPSPLIDECLYYLNKVKEKNISVLFSVIHRWIRLKLLENGFLVNSILNPSLQVQAPRFARSVKNILYDGVYDALCSVSGIPWILYQW